MEKFGPLPGSDTPPPRWYALHTRSRHEKLVAQQLADRGIEAFLPLRLEVHRWKDRYKKVEVPLFSGYVFARLASHASSTPGARLTVLKTSGVVRIVGFGRRDAPVPDEQIDSLRRLTESRVLLEPHRYLRAGQRVKVINGALAGVEGIVVRIRNAARLVISVASIRRAVSVELSGYEVVPIG